MKEQGFLELATAKPRSCLGAWTHPMPLKAQAPGCPIILLHWDKILSGTTTLRVPETPLALQSSGGKMGCRGANVFAVLKGLTTEPGNRWGDRDPDRRDWLINSPRAHSQEGHHRWQQDCTSPEERSFESFHYEKTHVWGINNLTHLNIIHSIETLHGS